MQLYENIKRRRKELGMTQTDLALRVGYADKTAIAHIEKGDIDLPQSKIVAFAKALQTTPGIPLPAAGRPPDSTRNCAGLSWGMPARTSMKTCTPITAKKKCGTK